MGHTQWDGKERVFTMYFGRTGGMHPQYEMKKEKRKMVEFIPLFEHSKSRQDGSGWCPR